VTTVTGLSAETRARLIWWAAEAFPDEACGVIVNGEAIQITNVHGEPEAFFQMADDELLAAYDRGIPSAVWHSHPNDDPTPSTADIDGHPPNMRMVIVAGGEVFFYDDLA
jgi:proteasome lid subunit RPN8/RPN11